MSQSLPSRRQTSVSQVSVRQAAPNEQHIHSLLLSHERQGRIVKHSGRTHIPPNDEMRAIRTINHRLKMLVELARYEDPDAELTAEELQAHTCKIANRYSALCSAYESALAAYKRNPDNAELQKALAASHMEYELSEAEGWDWATSASIAAYTGGSFGDEGAAVELPGLIEWRSMADGGPRAFKYMPR